MSKKHYTVNVCDMCGEEFETRGEITIGHLSYMILHNGSGSSRSDMELDLCPEDTRKFIALVEGR